MGGGLSGVGAVEFGFELRVYSATTAGRNCSWGSCRI